MCSLAASSAVADPATSRGWSVLALAYALTLASMAQVGVVAALTLDLAGALGLTAAQIGQGLALFSLPSALLAVPCGALVDRVGARRVLVWSGLAGGLADALAVAGGSPAALYAALLLSGLAFTGISVAAPALLAAAYRGGRQVRAMALWSTYAPAGFALGLVLGAPFAQTGHWVLPLALHGALLGILGLWALALPHLVPARPVQAGGLPDRRAAWRELGLVLRQPGVLRLALAVAVPSAISYGTSLVAPAWLARVHGASMAESATVVAAAKGVAMMLGGLAAGAVLARAGQRRVLFAGLAVAGALAQALLFWPGGSLALATAALFAWLLAFSGLGAVAMAQLPALAQAGAAAGTNRRGTVSGVVGQAISLLSFLAPAIYFGMAGWIGYVLLASGGLALAALALPNVAPREQEQS
ncbi:MULTISPECIES: MFS transporter [unclassified Novosphingobium]|uniref:MFS transporter n=1 Tax=unclassified Novosphingobium TaxID=2644732 RepID=UPI00146EA9DE|nr:MULTISPECIES: MFS transporter [unclassified Novosphingobium]NMN05142.1 MFS family permease [Novosphingobium sp. SG919]NMN87437.1 MFS family permease [Novosphingobium sp. SG916]